MYDILELNKKLLPELKEIAKELQIKRVDVLRKQDLVYKILDQQAVMAAERKARNKDSSGQGSQGSYKEKSYKRRGRKPSGFSGKNNPKSVKPKDARVNTVGDGGMIKLRIVSGKYKSRRISAPDDIRPTKDNVREAVFNVMAAYIKDAKVLDLFAGSGAFGLEALSRGASYALFVDNSVASARAVRKNLKSLESAEAAEVIAKDAIAAIKLLYKRGDKFDIIFLDPPYYGNLLRKCLKNINLYDILTHSGLIIAEHFKKDPVPAQAETLILTRQLVYGDTIISIYKKRLSDD